MLSASKSRLLRPLTAQCAVRVASMSTMPREPHIADLWSPPELAAKNNVVDMSMQRLARHWDDSAWDEAAIRGAQKDHVCATWAPGNSLDAVPLITSAEGVWLHASDGRKFIDWTSQAICVNMGHSVPPAVMNAITHQLETAPHVYSGLGMVEMRSRLSALMSDLLPAELTGMLFPSSGGEANEAAIRIARRFTGKHKVMTQYRSYHGGSASTLGATGDTRRAFAESGVTGFVHILNSTPWQFNWAEDSEENAQRALAALEEQILLEGADTIAAIMLESVVGSGGVLVPHPSYMQGVRALCDMHNILYIADEVMVGFGRTGKFWAFQHYDGVVPDIVTSAKGLSSAYLPLSMVAMNSELHEWTRTNPIGWGSTYQAHPVALACAYECVKHMIKEDLHGNAQRMEAVIAECQDAIVAKHPSVRQARAIGMFGCLDLIGPDGKYFQSLARAPPHKAVVPYKKALMDEGVYCFFRPPLFHSAPPLVINEAELRDGFARVDRALDVLDEHLGF